MFQNFAINKVIGYLLALRVWFTGSSFLGVQWFLKLFPLAGFTVV
jgi:hypothetical protein